MYSGYNSEGGYERFDHDCAPQADITATGHTSPGRQWSGYIHECGWHSTTWACSNWNQAPTNASTHISLPGLQRIATAAAGRLMPGTGPWLATSMRLHTGLTRYSSPSGEVSYSRPSPLDIWVVEVRSANTAVLRNLHGTIFVPDAAPDGINLDDSHLGLFDPTPKIVAALVSADGPPDSEIRATDVNNTYYDPAPFAQPPDAGPEDSALITATAAYSGITKPCLNTCLHLSAAHAAASIHRRAE